jgi:allophanate hydrolase
MIGLVAVGAHMRGLPLNAELAALGGVFVRAVETAPCYRLFLLPGGPPQRPGLLRVAEGGASVAAELWTLPPEGFGRFVAGVPAPLSIGTVLLADGRAEKGFLAEAAGTAGAEDITRFGGWRGFLAARAAA